MSVRTVACVICSVSCCDGGCSEGGNFCVDTSHASINRILFACYLTGCRGGFFNKSCYCAVKLGGVIVNLLLRLKLSVCNHVDEHCNLGEIDIIRTIEGIRLISCCVKLRHVKIGLESVDSIVELRCCVVNLALLRRGVVKNCLGFAKGGGVGRIAFGGVDALVTDNRINRLFKVSL